MTRRRKRTPTEEDALVPFSMKMTKAMKTELDRISRERNLSMGGVVEEIIASALRARSERPFQSRARR